MFWRILSVVKKKIRYYKYILLMFHSRYGSIYEDLEGEINMNEEEEAQSLLVPGSRGTKLIASH